MNAVADPFPMVLEYAPELLEAALLHALREHVEGPTFYQERAALYDIADPARREAAFQRLHVTWFTRLALGQVIEQALRERSLLLHQVQGCKVLGARSSRDEEAELFVAAAPCPPPAHAPAANVRRWIVLRLLPQRFAAPGPLLAFLHHELLHIADMLDPAFGYAPTLPPADGGPANDRLLRDRYRVLWDTSIDGRLWRLGWAPTHVRERRWHDFARMFPMLTEHLAEAFSHFFDGAAVTHADLVRFAWMPEGYVGPRSGRPQPGERCPLCRCPTHAFASQLTPFPAEVIRAIRADFPTWEPVQGLCQQCADIYSASAGQHTPTIG